MPEQRSEYNGCADHERSSPNLEVRHGRRQQALVMPGRHDVTHRQRGRKVQCEARPSKPYPFSLAAAPRVKSERSEDRSKGKTQRFLRSRFRLPRSETRRQAINTVERALPTHQVTVRNLNNAKQARGPECNRRSVTERQDPSASQAAQPTQTPGSETQQAKQRISKVRCGASGWHKHTKQARLPGPSSQDAGEDISKSNAVISHEQRNPPSWQGARPVRLPKTQWPMALHAIKSQVLQRKLAVRPPLRNNHGPTHQVTGIRRNHNPTANPIPLSKNSARHNGLRFRSGPSQPGSRHHDATAARRRTMEAEPRLRAGTT